MFPKSEAQQFNEASLVLYKDKHFIEVHTLYVSIGHPSCLSPHLSHFLSSHQHCFPVFLSFHKQSFYTHVPIRQGSVTTGQSEPTDNIDSEGPGSEITGQWENESWGQLRWKPLNRDRVGWKAGNCTLPPGWEMVVLTCVRCGHVPNVRTYSIDRNGQRGQGLIRDLGH